MNLFVLDTDPISLQPCLMEACTMAVEGHGETGVGLLCRPTHRNHPVTLWVGANWRWTLRYAYAVANEWQHRYGTTHGASERLPYIATMEDCLPAGDLLPFLNSARHGGFGLDFSHLPVPEAYRVYLMERWKTDKRPPTFRERGWPTWAQRSDQ